MGNFGRFADNFHCLPSLCACSMACVSTNHQIIIWYPQKIINFDPPNVPTIQCIHVHVKWITMLSIFGFSWKQRKELKFLKILLLHLKTVIQQRKLLFVAVSLILMKKVHICSTDHWKGIGSVLEIEWEQDIQSYSIAVICYCYWSFTSFLIHVRHFINGTYDPCHAKVFVVGVW